MINTDALYNTFIYFFTGYGVMACTINLFNLLNKANKVTEVTEVNFNEIVEVNFNEETKITVLIGICEIPKKLPPVILGSCWLKYHTCFLISYTWYLTSGFYYKMLFLIYIRAALIRFIFFLRQ